jgi:hypothetical protein
VIERASFLAGLLALAVPACAGPAASTPPADAPSTMPSASATASNPGLPVTAQPDVEIRDPGAAIVKGTPIAFDGIEEGLAWPSLAKAFPAPKTGDVITVQVARGVPIIHLLRAAWTLRTADLHLQALDATGTMHAVALKARRDGPPPTGCHLAVFLRPDGSLRVASPGGPVVVSGDDPLDTFARSLAAEQAKCPFRYVAFGSESDRSPFGPVFDVMLAVDASKAAGDARYVLGQAMHDGPAKPAPPPAPAAAPAH